MSHWSKLAAMSGLQWQVLLSAPFVLLVTWARLHFGGYRKALAAVASTGASALPAIEQSALARDTAYALAVAVKYGPWWPQCLLRSLALAWYLSRRGIPFEVRIGVPGGKSVISPGSEFDFTAHAWVEHAGNVLNDKQNIAREFSPFDVS